MKVLVIPDVHLKPWIFDDAEFILKNFNLDNAVFIGDLVDDWHKENYIDLYKDTIDRAMLFKCMNSDSIFCYGNHEVAYMLGDWCSGNSELYRPMIRSMLNQYERSVMPVLAIKIDNVVFSHAGIAKSYVADYRIENIDHIKLPTAFNDNDSPLWVRPDPWTKFNKDYIQVVGHSPVRTIKQFDNVWVTDTFSTNENGSMYGDRTFMSVDTVTGEITKYRNRNIVR